MKFIKKLLSVVTAAAIGLTMTTALTTGTATSTVSAASMTAVELVEDMGLGWNLGNALDSTNTWTANLDPSDIETAWGNVETTESMIKEIKKAGFNTVRIPVTWWDMTGTTGTANMDDFDGEVAEKFLARVKEVVDYCIDNDMYAIINTHHDEDWEKDTSKIDIFEKLWNQIATYFADYDEHLVFEGMNEVSFSSNAEAMTYNQAFVDTVRATGGNNSDRLLIVTAVSNNTAKALSSDFSMPDDDSDMLAVSVHYYEPSTFCVASTDSTWGYSSTWGTSAEYTTLENDFQDLKEKFTDNGYGVVIGEMGVCNADKYYTTTSYDKDQDSIEAYYEAVLSTAYDMEGICPIAWDDSDSGTIALFSRKTLSWYATEIYDIVQNVLAGGVVDTYEKTDRVSFDAVDIAEDGGDSWLIDLSDYKDLGVTISSVVVNYTMTSELGSEEYTGDMNMSFNIIEDGNDVADPTWCYLDSGSLAADETTYTFDFPSDNTFVTETDDDGNAVTTLTGELDMDYLKFESWWTWSGTTGDTVTITLDSVTIIFDGYIYTDEPATTTTAATTDVTTDEDTDTDTDTDTETTTSTDTTTATTTAATETPSGDPVGNAYLIGSFGTAENWAADGDGITAASVTGDGTYTVSWDLSEATSTGSSWFLVVQIDPEGDADTFTTDTFENLEVSLDSVTVDGVAIEDLSTAYVNTRYYESDGVTRIYLHDDWTKTGALVLDDMDIESNITVTFTVSGTGLDGGSSVEETTTTTTDTMIADEETTTTTVTTTESEETTTETTTTGTTQTADPANDSLLGDVNLDGSVSLADSIKLNKAVAGVVTLDGVGRTNADVNADGDVDADDALVLLKYQVGLVSSLPYTG